jgi:uncharacterized protein (DUF2345 family)
MKRWTMALAAAALAGGADVARAQSHVAVTSPAHDCAKAPNASVEADNGTVKFTGTCDSVLVKGSGNTLSLEAAKRIEVTGPRNVIEVAAVDFARLHSAGNTFRYRRGQTRPAPDVVAIGDNNSLVQGY